MPANLIDTALIRCGWVIQHNTKINLKAALGVAVQEYLTDIGPADYVLFVDAQAAAAMTGNPHFPEAAPTLADLSNSLKLFSDALALSKTGDRVKTVYKNQLRQNLDLLLTNWPTTVAL
ncbi:MAG: hypothetical protein ABIQ88_09420 [Chitinophagaceae bacterium]